MTAPGWPAGWGLVQRDEVASTMAEAARLSATAAGPLWILARRQSAGRGRRGQVWTTPPGNLAATALLPCTEPPARAALRSFAAALALHDALTGLGVAPAALTLKWPNDVLLNGAKLAGILLETLPGGWLAIGIGVNLAAAPRPEALAEGALPPTTLVEGTGLLIPPEDALLPLAAALAHWEGRLVTEGFAPLRCAWLARASHLGRPVRLRSGPLWLHGRFETVDDSGLLVLATPEGRRSFAAGEVSLRPG